VTSASFQFSDRLTITKTGNDIGAGCAGRDRARPSRNRLFPFKEWENMPVIEIPGDVFRNNIFVFF
jgi:hypothetical protein